MRYSVDQTSGEGIIFSSCDNQETTASSPCHYRQIQTLCCRVVLAEMPTEH